MYSRKRITSCNRGQKLEKTLESRPCDVSELNEGRTNRRGANSELLRHYQRKTFTYIYDLGVADTENTLN